MKTVTIKGYLTFQKYDWQDQPTYNFTTYNPNELGLLDEHVIREHSIEVEVPEDFDPTPQKLAALRKLREGVVEKFTKELDAVDGQIKNLLALEHKTPAPATDGHPF